MYKFKVLQCFVFLLIFLFSCKKPNQEKFKKVIVETSVINSEDTIVKTQDTDLIDDIIGKEDISTPKAPKQKREEVKIIERPSFPINGHFRINPVVDSAYDALIASLEKEKLFDFKEFYKGIIPNIRQRLPKRPLEKNYENFKSNLSGIRIYFARKKQTSEEDKRSFGDEEEHFYLELGFEDVENEQFVFVALHSQPVNKNYLSGVRLTAHSDREARFFIKGQNEAGVAILVPKVKTIGPRGMLVCPRDYEYKKVKGGSRTLENYNYRIIGIDYAVQSKLEGQVLSGLGQGYATAGVFTTPNIFQATTFYDESMTVNPHVAIEYIPDSSEKINFTKDFTEDVSGVLIRLVLHNSFNQKVVTTGLVKASLKKVNLEKRIFLKHSGVELKLEKGPCLAIVKEMDLAYEFVKEPLPNR